MTGQQLDGRHDGGEGIAKLVSQDGQEVVLPPRGLQDRGRLQDRADHVRRRAHQDPVRLGAQRGAAAGDEPAPFGAQRDVGLELLTRDQTMAARLAEAGVLEPDKADKSPFKHILSQALGTNGALTPVITDFSLRDGDRVLLCSDGLHGPVPDETISLILSVSRDPAQAAHALVDAALAAGGPDNVTVVVADCGRLEAEADGGRRS